MVSRLAPMNSPIWPPMSPVDTQSSASQLAATCSAQPSLHPRGAHTKQLGHLIGLLLLHCLVVEGLKEDVQHQHVLPGGKESWECSLDSPWCQLLAGNR